MLKQLAKIAKTNESSFKLSKSDLMNSSKHLKPVYHQSAEDIGFFNVFFNSKKHEKLEKRESDSAPSEGTAVCRWLPGR